MDVWEDRVLAEIQHQHGVSVEAARGITVDGSPRVVGFSAVIAGLLVDLLLGVLKQCLMQHVLAQHRAVNRRPDGRVAMGMRSKFEQVFLEKHSEHDEVAVKAHVDSAMEAFREATESEVVDLVRDTQLKPSDPTDDDWEHAAIATALGDAVFAAKED